MVRPLYPIKLLNSKYLVMEPENWHLLPGAPDDIKKEFDEYMRTINMELEEDNED